MSAPSDLNTAAWFARMARQAAEDGRETLTVGFTPQDLAQIAAVLARGEAATPTPAAHDRAVKAEAWDQGAAAAWERSTTAVNGERYHWRHEGEPANPYRADRIETGEEP